MITPLIPHAAVLVKKKQARTLVVADLHLGWEMALLPRGINLPSQTPAIARRLKTLISMYRPKELLVLGDVKHTVATAEPGEWHDIPTFFQQLSKLIDRITVVPGNHDGNLEPMLPEEVELLTPTGTIIESVGFFHGHCWPSPKLLACRTLVMGHIHPMIALRDTAGFRITRQIWVKAKCDGRRLAETLLKKSKTKTKNSIQESPSEPREAKPLTSELLIMPSFNDFLGGRPLNARRPAKSARRIVGPVIRSKAVDVEGGEVLLLDGTFLGALNHLDALD